MTSSELLVRIKNKKGEKKKKKVAIDTVHTPDHGHYNNNNNIAFHSVILQIDVEKETKKELSKMFVAKIKCFYCLRVLCVTQRRHLQYRKKNILFGWTELDSIQ